MLAVKRNPHHRFAKVMAASRMLLSGRTRPWPPWKSRAGFRRCSRGQPAAVCIHATSIVLPALAAMPQPARLLDVMSCRRHPTLQSFLFATPIVSILH